MRIMIDTNVIIFAVLFPQGRAAQAFMKAVSAPYQPIVCDYIVEELKRKFEEKFPARMIELNDFLKGIFKLIEVVPTPKDEVGCEDAIRDPKDRPILRAALNEHAELFLTGDKDFLESSVTDPRIIGVAEFLEK